MIQSYIYNKEQIKVMEFMNSFISYLFLESNIEFRWHRTNVSMTVSGLSAALSRQSRQFGSTQPAGLGMRQNAHLHLPACVGFY